MDNNDWVEQNLQRQRKLLEQKQKLRRMQSPVVRANALQINSSTAKLDSPGSYSPPKSSGSGRWTSSSSCYDGPLAYQMDPDDVSPHPMQRKSRQSSSDKSDIEDALAHKMEKADLSTCVPSDDDDLGSTPNLNVGPCVVNGIETHTLPGEMEPNYDEVMQSVETFVTSVGLRNTVYRCSITRERKGLDKMYPTYYLHLERGDKKKGIFLLAARKRKKCKTANYLITTDPTDLSRDTSSVVGKVRSNAVGTAFTVYDNGVNPKKSNAVEVREELAAVLYETNVLGFKGPRRMTIIIPGIFEPNVNDNFKRTKIAPVDDKDTLIERFKRARNDQHNHDIVIMQNKNPMWSEESQSYVLNFHGRVTNASVKNFQVIHPLDPDYIVMQFGRADEDQFTMDFRYPLSAIQAFGIAMTSFHGKLACE